MQLELPDRLHATRDLLMRSLIPQSGEPAPSMPASLALDLADRFAPRSPLVPVSATLSWLQRARHFLASPAFGAVAAAVVLLGAALPLLQRPVSLPKDSLRGAAGEVAAETVRILFIGDHPAAREAVVASGMFEPDAISSIARDTDAEALPGPKVLVDLATSTITAIDRDGATIHRVAVPSSAANLADAIAFAVSTL
jgi:hypothetical protein